MGKSYMGDHDFRRWQRAVVDTYYRELGIEEGDLPPIDLRARYDAKETAEDVGRELANRERSA